MPTPAQMTVKDMWFRFARERDPRDEMPSMPVFYAGALSILVFLEDADFLQDHIERLKQEIFREAEEHIRLHRHNLN